MKKSLLSLIAIVILIVGLVGCSSKEAPGTPVAPVPSTPVTSIAKVVGPSIDARDQVVENILSVSGNLDKAGFVVVHLVKDGSFAEVVGNSDSITGKFNTEIRIDGEPTDKLNVMLHYDTNNNGIYEFGSVEGADGPVIVDGQVIMTEFKALKKEVMVKPSKVSVQPQPVTNSVSGISGFIDQPGFVVVHLVKNGAFAEVVGNTPVNGEFNDVNVAVSEKTERLNVMLHYDTNNNGIYEFGSVEGADGPVTNNGVVAMTEFDVLKSSVTSVFVSPQRVSNAVTGISGFLEQPGFVVVHLVKDGSFAEVVGNSAQLKGAFSGLEIPITNKTNRLNIMLHHDTNNNGVYEFGKVEGADGPVINNGVVAMIEFDVISSKPVVNVKPQRVNEQVSGISGYLDKPGFVVVHLIKDGVFAEVVGNSQSLNGEFNNIAVPVTAKTDKLNIMLHYDSNNNGVYEFGSVEGADGPATFDGKVVMIEFDVKPNTPEISASSQRVTSKVTGISGFLDQPGFVVVHLVKDGSFAKVVGNSLPLNGEFNNVEVPVTETSSKLNIMLHYDTNKNGVYEFGTVEGADGPVLLKGQVAMLDINVITEGSKQIVYSDAGFDPAEIAVEAGSIVTWLHQGSKPMIVKGVDNTFKSPRLKNGDSYQYTFEKPGKYSYLNTVIATQKGKVIVG